MTFPVTTTMMGQCVAFPDTCNTPSATGTVPITYSNVAETSQADSLTCSLYVKIENMPVCSVITLISSSTGDEAGTGMGTSSGTIKGIGQYSAGSTMVTVEGQGVVFQGSPTEQNGISANAPLGAQTSASQAYVTTGG